MSHYQRTSCPHCGSDLRVKPAYFGHQVVCKRCDKPFVLEVPEAEVGDAGEGEPSALEKLWEDEASRPERPTPARPARSTPPRPSLEKPGVNLDDSSMLIPVRRDGAGTSVADRPDPSDPPDPSPEPPPKSRSPEPAPQHPQPRQDDREQARARGRALRQEIGRREENIKYLEAQVRAEIAAIDRLREELERVENG